MKETGITRRDFLKMVATTAIVGTIAVPKNGVDAVSLDSPTPNYGIEPVSIPNDVPEPKLLTSAPRTIIEFPKKPVEQKLSPAQIRERQIKRELHNIQKIMSGHPKTFSDKKREDVEIYYPIYRAVADKYKLDWYLLFIVHEAETGASSGKRGFAPGAQYEGAMQLDRATWSQEYIESAVKGLKRLARLPQRHSDDWKNIAAAGKILSANIRKYRKLGKEEAVLNALLLYSADDQALRRFKTYREYEKFFPAKKKRTNIGNLAIRRAS